MTKQRDIELVGIHLNNIRGFVGSNSISLNSKLTVIVGPNNVGKSTLLRVMMIMASSWGKLAQERVALLSPYVRRGADSFEIALRFRLQSNVLDFRTILRSLDFELKDKHNTFTSVDKIPEFSHFFEPDSRVELSIGLEQKGERFVVFHANKSAGSVYDDLRFVGGLLSSPTTGENPYSNPPTGSNLNNIYKFFGNYFLRAPFAAWSHKPWIKGEAWQQPTRRLEDDEDQSVQQALLYLKIKHEDSAFKHLRLAILNAFQEFQELDFFDKGGFDYRPSLQPTGVGEGTHDTDRLLTRELLGNGSWSYLSILTAAHAAKATGAQLFILDEPHLYLHPGLERQLIRELTGQESASWDDARPWHDFPLQLVVATHSPSFVDAAWQDGQLYILDWNNPEHTEVKAHDVTAVQHSIGGIAPRFWQGLISSPSDMIYAERVMFVEGPSDVVAIQTLIRGLGLSKEPIHIEPLLVSDLVKKKQVIDVLPLIARSRRGGLLIKPILMLDNDKKLSAEADWGKKPVDDPRTKMRVIFIGKEKNDFESTFCELDFLCEYFKHRCISLNNTQTKLIENKILAMAGITKTKSELASVDKGWKLVADLHQELLNESDIARNKEGYLVVLIDFLINNRDKIFSQAVLNNLQDLTKALGKPDE